MATRLPLEGIRVLDITVVWAGPYGTMFLADMGAEVIRVEPLNVFPSTTRGRFARPSREAEARAPSSWYVNRDPGERPWNRTALFNSHARNKYSVTADLTTPEGKDIFRRLVEISDVFVENNALGSMERLGLTYPTVSGWNPRLIMLSSTGMGQTGPWSGYRGLGLHFEAMYGHAAVTGYPDMDVSGTPTSVAADAAAGAAIAFAVVSALHQRQKTGRGAFIDLAQGENFVHHLGELFMDYTINGRVAGTLGNRDPMLVQGCYPCRGDDEWVAVSLARAEDWRVLCGLMERPDLAEDGRFATMEGLRLHHDEVDAAIGAWTADRDPIPLFHLLQGAGLMAGPVLHEEHAYRDPHLEEQGFFVPVTHADAGTHRYPSTAFNMSRVPFAVRKPPVRLGEDNDYVYRDLLGLSEEEYDRLKATGQVGTEYAPHVR